jgi:hypothetical protein
MKTVARNARRSLGWFIFASGNLVGLALLMHGLTA